MSEKAEPATNSLQGKLKLTSKKVHDLSNVLVSSKLVVLFTDRVLYGQALSCFYFMFEHLERLCTELLATDAGFAPFKDVLPKLYRAPGFYKDLVYFLGEEGVKAIKETPEVAAYKAHLSMLAQANPILLLSHCYTQHLAMASGGQMIKVMARKKMQLPADQGTASFDFEGSPSALKTEFLDQLNILGGKLSPGNTQAMLDEHVAAFHYNNSIINRFPIGWLQTASCLLGMVPSSMLMAAAGAVGLVAATAVGAAVYFRK